MSEKEARGRPPYRRVMALACLLALLVAGVWMGLRLSRMWRAATALQADLTAARSLAAGGDIRDVEPEEAIDLLHTTRADLLELRDAARPFLWLAPRLGWLPRHGPDIQAAPTLLEIALHLTAAGEKAVEPLKPLLERAPGSEGTAGDEALLREAAAALAAARPQLRDAQASVRDAEAAREKLDVATLDPRLRSQLRLLDRYLPLLERGLKGALLAPRLLGASGGRADGPRTYLVLVQNEDELRATGGFISAVAQVTVEEGELQDLQFEDSYAVDDFSQPYPDPPEPLRRYMLADLWIFRDSNWSPDFPTSAQKAIELYTVGRDVELDGVIALDQRAIQLLVGALGPLEVEGSDELITGDNVIQAARQAWSPGEDIDREWWRHRKDIMSAVLDAAIHRVEGGLERERSLRLAKAVRQALRRKHLLLYLEDEEAASLVADLGWDGAMRRGSGDYLMVVDTNMGFNKVNGLVEEELEYVVDLSDPHRPRATLAVRHRHPLEDWEGPCRQNPRYDATYAKMMERCYWDYLRVYVPAGSELLDATPHSVPARALLSGQPSPAEVRVKRDEDAHDVLTTFFLLRPGEVLETRFEYALPRGVVRARDGEYAYSLMVQKQPGTRGTPLHVRVLLPTDAVVEEADPERSDKRGAKLAYDLTLETDREISVAFRPAR